MGECTIPKDMCEKCWKKKTEYVGFDCLEGDDNNPWDCLSTTCEQDEKDLQALINPPPSVLIPNKSIPGVVSIALDDSAARSGRVVMGASQKPRGKRPRAVAPGRIARIKKAAGKTITPGGKSLANKTAVKMKLIYTKKKDGSIGYKRVPV